MSGLCALHNILATSTQSRPCFPPSMQLQTLPSAAPAAPATLAKARPWDRVVRKCAAGPFVDPSAHEETLRRAKVLLSPEHTMLEVGCGTGTTALQLAGFAHQLPVAGVLPRLIFMARDKLAGHAREQRRFGLADAASLLARGEQHEAVQAHAVQHHFAGLDRGFDAATLSLKSEGSFVSGTACLTGVNPITPRMFARITRALDGAPEVPVVGAIRLLVCAALAISGCCFWTSSFAQSALVHVQGEDGQREAYFANFAVVMSRTPADKLLGPTSVRQLDTVVVYESAAKPEFSALRLQFECVVKYPYDGKKVPPQPAFDAPVTVRVGDGSWMLRREDLKSEPLPPGTWRTSSSPVLLKLHKVACHEDVMRGAMVKAARANNDLNVFRSEIRKIGLPEDLQLVTQQTAAEYLDFSWWVLWHGAKRPDPSGKWSRRPTKKELQEAQAQMAQIQRQVDAMVAGMKPGLETDLRQLEARFAFDEAAADLRRGRAMSRNERLMLSAWEGKTDTEVGAAFGAPVVSTAGGLRFLSYGKEFDNRVVVGNRKGAVWEEGMYESCNVQFVMLLDDKQLLRVADVRIWANSSQGGQVMFACVGLLEAPR